ncbi:antibiotic biosynthesis monooxygenase family protein [Spirosoma aerolatum]|uniref:antibiotic biosynthesis monooxygenase family protein n=1 Tax=Spirosoma aerolatum TaxID=1211326 RepID=UPI0009AE2685|nr:antibiotic biosynthesis monooxygenase [Spirosoma aerolatum]
MYARIIQFPLKPESIDEAVSYFQNTVGPALQNHEGFQSSRMLSNSETNKGLMVTLWDTEANRQAAETNGFLQGVIKHMSNYFAGPPIIDYYEVNVQVP